MSKYQNVSQSLVASLFTEVGSFTGTEVSFKVKTPKINVNGQQVSFVNGAVAVSTPIDVTSCGTGCVIGTVKETASLSFNVTTEAGLDALKAELDRVYLLTKASLVHGVLPPVYSTFAKNE